jgi:outer membrane protein assembly factor BamB
MPLHPRRPRSGRLLDAIFVALLVFVFAGLGVYHFRRLDLSQVDVELARELAKQKLGEQVSKTTDWPQWRGPNRDGVSTETDILTDWPASGPKVLWEAKVGEGFSSVAVVKGRVFTIFQDGDNESVVSWDAESGKEVWRHSYACAYKNSYGNGPRSTPSVDGDFVYTVGATGIMHCLKAFTQNPKGELVWAKNLLQEFAAPTPQWGVAFSPLIEGNRIYIMPGGPAGNSLAALDKTTGAILWKNLEDPAGYSSPIAATFQDQRQIVFFTGIRLVGVHPDTGGELWHYDWPTSYHCNVATPIIVPDYVFLSSGYARGCAMLKIDKIGGQWKPSFVYKHRRIMKTQFTSCVRSKDHVFGFDDVNLTCMNFHTGEVQWEKHGFDIGSVLLVNDHLIIYGANGLLALAEANPTKYVEKSRFPFSAQKRACWSVPVVSNGRLYVRDQVKLVCFDVKAVK